MSREIKQAWINQIGPAYTRDAVADLLGTTAQAVAKRQGLLELEQSDGRIVYSPVLDASEPGRHRALPNGCGGSLQRVD